MAEDVSKEESNVMSSRPTMGLFIPWPEKIPHLYIFVLKVDPIMIRPH